MKYEGRVVNTQTGMTEAGCSGNDRERVAEETTHYLAVYSQDGPYHAEMREKGKRWKAL